MDRELKFNDYFKIILRYRVSIYIIMITSLVSIFLLSFLMPKYYKATAYIFVPSNIRPFGLSTTQGLMKTAPVPIANSQIMSSYQGILESYSLAQKIAQKVGVQSVDSIRKQRTIKKSQRHFNFKISVRDRIPEMAAKIANAYVVEANKLLQERSLEPVKITRQHLEERIQKTEKDLHDAERRLEQFKNTYNTVSADNEKAQLIQQRTSFLSQLKTSQVRLNEVAANIAVSEEIIKKEGKMHLSSESVTINPVINSLRTNISSIEIAIAGARTKYSEEHPEMIRLKTELAQSKKNLKKEVAKILGSQTESINPVHEKLRQMLVDDVVTQKSLQARIIGLEKVIKDLDQQIARYPDLDKKLANLYRQVSNYVKALQQLRIEFEEIKLQEIRELQTFSVLDQAKVPKKPVFPILWINLATGGFLALILGVIYAFSLDYFMNRTASKEEPAGSVEFQQPIKKLIGKIFNSLGMLKQNQNLQILEIQKRKPKLLYGEIAVKLGYVTDDQVKQALEIQNKGTTSQEMGIS